MELAPKIKLYETECPDIAEKGKPGQFIIVMNDKQGERIPISLAGVNEKTGTISFAFNEVGKTTKQLGCLQKGEYIESITGPLGNPSEIKEFGNILCVAGGVMIAPMLFLVKSLKEMENSLTLVLGGRNKEAVFYEDEMKRCSAKTFVATDDGSYGNQGLAFLKEILNHTDFDRCIAWGPVTMMKRVCELTKPFQIPTVVSLLPIMIDGMGMCGVCRVTVDGKMRFGCVDGPEFNGHLVDFEGLIRRQRMFLPEERLSSLLWELKQEKCNHD